MDLPQWFLIGCSPELDPLLMYLAARRTAALYTIDC